MSSSRHTRWGYFSQGWEWFRARRTRYSSSGGTRNTTNEDMAEHRRHMIQTAVVSAAKAGEQLVTTPERRVVLQKFADPCRAWLLHLHAGGHGTRSDITSGNDCGRWHELECDRFG